jgi:hypothetical protein
MLRLARRIVAIAFAIAAWPALAALVADDLKPLADESAGAKLAAIDGLVASGDPRAAAILTALKDDSLAVTRQGAFVIAEGDGHVDALTGAKARVDAASLEPIPINNRIRGRIDAALAAFDLLAPERSVRARAIAALEKAPDPALATLIDAAAARETDAGLKSRCCRRRSGSRARTGRLDSKRSRSSARAITRPRGSCSFPSSRSRRTGCSANLTRRCARRPSARSARSTPRSARASSPGRCSPGCRSAACCFSPRSASRSPTA